LLLPASAGVAALLLIAGVYAWRAPQTVNTSLPEAAAATASPASANRMAEAEKPAVESLDAAALAARIDNAAPASPLAWKQLLKLWELPSDDLSIGVAASCPFAVSVDAYCLRARGALDRLVAQDRPVLLHLRNGARDAWAVLLGADARRARIALDDRTLDIDRIALSRYWDGEYAALWRGPSNLALPITESHPSLPWIRDHLATRYLPVDAVAVLNADMQSAVRRFQGDRGLASDGVIGPETLMALAAGDEGGPRLLAGLE
jgi:general secretion pathway protein A